MILTLIQVSPKLNPLELLLVSSITQFENDILKTVEAGLLTKRLMGKQTDGTEH